LPLFSGVHGRKILQKFPGCARRASLLGCPAEKPARGLEGVMNL
jgi:hypothetical protein